MSSFVSPSSSQPLPFSQTPLLSRPPVSSTITIQLHHGSLHRNVVLSPFDSLQKLANEAEILSGTSRRTINLNYQGWILDQSQSVQTANLKNGDQVYISAKAVFDCNIELVFMIDKSSSMEGPKHGLVEEILPYLNSESWMVSGVNFHLFTFDTELTRLGKFPKGLVFPSFYPDGGTCIEKCSLEVLQYLKSLESTSSPRNIVFVLLTDAEDTIDDPGYLRTAFKTFADGYNTNDKFFTSVVLFLKESDAAATCQDDLKAAFGELVELSLEGEYEDDPPVFVAKEIEALVNHDCMRRKTEELSGKAEAMLTESNAGVQFIKEVEQFTVLFDEGLNLLEQVTEVYTDAEALDHVDKADPVIAQISALADKYISLVDQFNKIQSKGVLDQRGSLQELNDEIVKLRQEARDAQGAFNSIANWGKTKGISQKMKDRIGTLGRVFTKENIQNWQNELRAKINGQVIKFMNTNVEMNKALQDKLHKLEENYEKLEQSLKKFASEDVGGLQSNLDDVRVLLEELGKKHIAIKNILVYRKIKFS